MRYFQKKSAHNPVDVSIIRKFAKNLTMQTPERAELLSEITSLAGNDFEATALRVFRYQAACNPLYARYLSLLGRDPAAVRHLGEIPFLPIQLFKHFRIQTGDWTPEMEFTSSGTTGQTPSRHLVRNRQWYRDNTLRGFRNGYGDPADWLVLALLPNYLERTGSSLVDMADFFIGRSRQPDSGFFLYDTEKLLAVLERRPTDVPVLLLGVAFALLDLAEKITPDTHHLFKGVTVMETGGMKGRRREMTRSELHETLCAAFGVPHIHSEYGMTELFSQAYAAGSEWFAPSPTLRAFATEVNDPFALVLPGRVGVLQFIDLANIDTCSFIATEDVGRVREDGHFQALGRLDAAEMRGCNLMVI